MADPAILAASAATAGYADYLAIAVVGALAIGMVAGILWAVWFVTRVVGRITTTPTKTSTYECGETPVGPAWQRFNLRFYLVAIVFLIFDVELVLVLPTLPLFAPAIAAGHGLAVFLKIFLFVATLLLGLVYAAAKGDFAWDKSKHG
jgi:NADH-quinone oxidoreductase subunit A